MGRTVLVTGAARQLGGRVARRLRQDPEVDRVLAVDSRPLPGPLGDVTVIRADIRRPEIAAVLAEHAVDTVVHLDVHDGPASGSAGGGARSGLREANVLGTLQLVGACQRIPGLNRVIVRSSTRIYGGDARDPAVFSESAPPAAPATAAGFARDVAEIEGYVRSFARRRPDVAVTVLRFAHILGPLGDSAFAAYLRMPVLPTVLGYDPRLQFVHEDDVVEVVGRAVAAPDRADALTAGTFNVAGDGVMVLSQAARRLGRPTVPVASPLAGWLGAGLRALGVGAFSAEQVRSLVHGRVVRTDRLREALGRPLEYTTAEAFADFAAAHGPGLLPPSALAGAARRLEEALRGG
ncbi:NAD-dependent epimerase/dehydratase family protein [Streptomyces sp. 4N509B]|uniref:NAD-dependent epimerase/dehydratase family protein n=1 Tax=Streptomyces sp. 4N509B TaxID=3457413 RepID=UPI003FD65E42